MQRKPRKKNNSQASTGFEPRTDGLVLLKTEKDVHVQVIVTVMKRFKQSQRKPRKNSET